MGNFVQEARLLVVGLNWVGNGYAFDQSKFNPKTILPWHAGPHSSAFFHFTACFWAKASNLQWGTNQNVVFEITVRKISRLPTLKASRELKNWYFPVKFLRKHYL
jgi:hypothetical protein